MRINPQEQCNHWWNTVEGKQYFSVIHWFQVIITTRTQYEPLLWRHVDGIKEASYQQLWPLPGATGWGPRGSSRPLWSAQLPGALAGCTPHLWWWAGSSLQAGGLPTPPAWRWPGWCRSPGRWAPTAACRTGSTWNNPPRGLENGDPPPANSMLHCYIPICVLWLCGTQIII